MSGIPYAVSGDMIRRFGEAELIELTDRDGSAGAIVRDVLDSALKDAMGDIDGYLGGRYRTPIFPAPPMLTRLACDLARYYLYDNRLDDSHPAARRYQAAVRLLEQLAAGRVPLGVTRYNLEPDGTAGVEMDSEAAVFKRDRSRGFI